MQGNFTVDLGDGFLLDPTTGAVFDAQSNQMFGSADELLMDTGGQEGSSTTDPVKGAASTVAAVAGGSALADGVNSLINGVSGVSATPAASSVLPYGGDLGQSLAAEGINTGTNAAAGTANPASSAMSSLAMPLAVVGGGIGTYQGLTDLNENLTDGDISRGDSAQLGTVASNPLGAYQTGVYAPLGESLGVDSRATNNAMTYGNYAGAASTGAATAGTAALMGANMWNPVGWYLGASQVLGFDPTLGIGGTSKSKDQYHRDAIREYLRDGGFFDEPDESKSDKLTLSDGNTFDWGKDGGARLQNQGINLDGNSDRRYMDVDFSNEASGDVVADLDPLGYLLGGKDRGSDMTGYAVNHAQSTGNTMQAVKDLYAKAGLDWGTAREGISNMEIDQGKKDSFYNSLDRVYGVNAYAPKKGK